MARGRHKSRGRPGPQAQLKWAGEDEAMAPNGEEEHQAATLSVWLSSHCLPTSQSFPCVPALGWHHLKSSSPAGARGTCSSLSGKNMGLELE